MTETTRQYYAVVYPYGVASLDNGEPARSVLAFGTRAERDAYVDNGGDYRTNGNWRDAVSRADLSARELRESERCPRCGDHRDTTVRGHCDDCEG